MLRTTLVVLAGCLLWAMLSITYAQAPSKMYWANSGFARIERANLDGTGREFLITSLTSSPYGIAVDFRNSPNKVYWTAVNPDKIQRANLDGSGKEDLGHCQLNS